MRSQFTVIIDQHGNMHGVFPNLTRAEEYLNEKYTSHTEVVSLGWNSNVAAVRADGKIDILYIRLAPYYG